MGKEYSIVSDLDTLIDYSRFYFYDKEYESHIKNIKKLKKHIAGEKDEKYIKDGCDLY